MIRLRILFLFLYVSTNIFSQNEKGITFRNDLKSAVELAKKEDKSIFLYFHVSNCVACDELSKNFRNKSLGKLYNDQYLSYALNIDELGEGLAENFGVVDFPTLVYVTPKKKVKFRARGYRDGKSLFEIGELARLAPMSIRKTMNKKYKSNPNDTQHLYDFIEYLYLKDDYPKVEKLLKVYFDQRDKIEKGAWMNLVLDYASNPDSYASEILFKEKEEFIKRFGAQFTNETIWNILIDRISQKYNSAEIELFEKQFIKEAEAIGYNPKDDNLVLFYSEFLLSINVEGPFGMREADKNIVTNYALQAINVEDHIFKPEHLIAISVHFISFHQKEDALKKLYEVLESNFEKKPHYTYIDLQSVLLYMKGNEEAAVQKIIEAREFALSQGYEIYQPSITEFRRLKIID